MMAHNVCYCTLLPAGREKRPDPPPHSVAPATATAMESDTATCFVDASLRRGLLPSILERLLAARKATKKELAACGGSPEDDMRRKILNGRQLALKLSANSVYGFTGAMNGPLPCLEVAGAVTAYGREMIQATKRLVESKFSKANGYAFDSEVVYGDTDSVMVRFGPEGDGAISLEEAMRLSAEAGEVCSGAFPPPVRLEFEKIYRPFLIMAKKRYAGLSWSSPDAEPKIDTKGIETVRRDWSDLVRQGLDRTLQLLLRRDGADGVPDATAYVRGLCDDLRQNKVDFRALVISKSLGRDDYAGKMAHVEVAEKMRKRDPSTAPRFGDRVSYLVTAGAAKAKVYERAEDPLFALEHDLPVDADYYLESQLKQPLVRVFELVSGSAQKAEQALFAVSAGSGPTKVVVAPAGMGGGMGKFMRPKPKCLGCGATMAKDGEAFCPTCGSKGPEQVRSVTEACIAKAKNARATLEELQAHCATRCSVPPGDYQELPAYAATTNAPTAAGAAGKPGRETCINLNCQVIFRRVRAARELKAAVESLTRLKVADW